MSFLWRCCSGCILCTHETRIPCFPPPPSPQSPINDLNLRAVRPCAHGSVCPFVCCTIKECNLFENAFVAWRSLLSFFLSASLYHFSLSLFFSTSSRISNSHTFTMAPSPFISHCLYVRHPTLGDQPPDNVGDFSMPSCGPCTAWKVRIERTGAQLEVSVGLWEPNKEISLQSMSLASFKGGRHWDSTFDKLVLQEGKRVSGKSLIWVNNSPPLPLKSSS